MSRSFPPPGRPRSSHPSPIPALLLIPSLLAVPGCGGGGPRLTPVSGTVTLEGKPVGGAHVAFAPTPDNPAGTPGGDISGSSGYYKAMHEGRAGLAPGRYAVLVSINGPDAPDRFAAATAGDDYMRSIGDRARSTDDPSVLRVRIEATFDREVTTGGGTFDFDLKKPPPPEPEEPPAKPGTRKKGGPGSKGNRPPGSPLGKMYRN